MLLCPILVYVTMPRRTSNHQFQWYNSKIVLNLDLNLIYIGECKHTQRKYSGSKIQWLLDSAIYNLYEG